MMFAKFKFTVAGAVLAALLAPAAQAEEFITIGTGELELGVAQSDWQYHAYNGTSRFEDEGAFEGLCAVFSVHPEPFTVVARADSRVSTFDDLKGKHVNIGNPGSGSVSKVVEILRRRPPSGLLCA